MPCICADALGQRIRRIFCGVGQLSEQGVQGLEVRAEDDPVGLFGGEVKSDGSADSRAGEFSMPRSLSEWFVVRRSSRCRRSGLLAQELDFAGHDPGLVVLLTVLFVPIASLSFPSW